jgi:hypothetical protein
MQRQPMPSRIFKGSYGYLWMQMIGEVLRKACKIIGDIPLVADALITRSKRFDLSIFKLQM